MSPVRGESRRSTRVALTVLLAAQGISEPLISDGETIVVSRHGALIFCSAPLRVGLEIEIHVIITDKHAAAKVVRVDPERPQVCGIELAEPENIWGLLFPPDDWYDKAHES
jgi:PilZ domain